MMFWVTSPTTIRVPAGTTAGTRPRRARPAQGPWGGGRRPRSGGGNLKDLSWAPEIDINVEPVAANTDDGRKVIRHSCAHVLAPGRAGPCSPTPALGIGPPITDGFYYDFDVAEPSPRGSGDLGEEDEADQRREGNASRRVYASRTRRAPNWPPAVQSSN